MEGALLLIILLHAFDIKDSKPPSHSTQLAIMP